MDDRQLCRESMGCALSCCIALLQIQRAFTGTLPNDFSLGCQLLRLSICLTGVICPKAFIHIYIYRRLGVSPRGNGLVSCRACVRAVWLPSGIGLQKGLLALPSSFFGFLNFHVSLLPFFSFPFSFVQSL